MYVYRIWCITGAVGAPESVRESTQAHLVCYQMTPFDTAHTLSIMSKFFHVSRTPAMYVFTL